MRSFCLFLVLFCAVCEALVHTLHVPPFVARSCVFRGSHSRTGGSTLAPVDKASRRVQYGPVCSQTSPSTAATKATTEEEIPPLKTRSPIKLGLIIEPTPFTHVR